MKSPIQLFIFLAILLATATVAAQVYKWVDKDGKVQYTDTPPPPTATRAETKKVDAPSSGAAVTAPATAKPAPDRVKEFDKRRNEAAEKTKKDSEAQANAEIDAENCRDARTALIDLESGRPINRSNDKGERVFISDEQRQAEITKARAMAAAACKE